MKRHRLAILGLGSIVTLGLSLPVNAGAPSGSHRPGLSGPPGPHGPPGAHLERAVERLELDAETRERAYATLDAAHLRERSLRRQLRGAHEVLRTLLRDPDSEVEGVMESVDAVGALELELARTRARTLLDLRAMLSPEQRARFGEEVLPPRRATGPRRSPGSGAGDRAGS